ARLFQFVEEEVDASRDRPLGLLPPKPLQGDPLQFALLTVGAGQSRAFKNVIGHPWTSNDFAVAFGGVSRYLRFRGHCKFLQLKGFAEGAGRTPAFGVYARRLSHLGFCLSTASSSCPAGLSGLMSCRRRSLRRSASVARRRAGGGASGRFRASAPIAH